MVAVLCSVELAVVAGAAEGDGLIELFGLKKSARVFFAGDGDGATVGETAAVFFPLRAYFSAGEGDASVTPGEGEVAAVVFFVLRVRFSAGEGDASIGAAGEAVASAFLCVRCFAGEGDAAGDSVGVSD